MEIKNVRVYGLGESIIASGYPMVTETPDEYNFSKKAMDLEHEIFQENLQAKDFNRAIKLAQTPKGSAHDQFLTGITVQFDLTCTNKMWVEMERYRFVFFVSSQSTMHRMSKFDLDKCYNKYVDPRIIEIMRELQERYNETKNIEDFYRLVYSNPAGFELTARLTTNYRALKTIYSQRKTHRLKEWQEFCEWIETLPMAEELIVGRD